MMQSESCAQDKPSFTCKLKYKHKDLWFDVKLNCIKNKSIVDFMNETDLICMASITQGDKKKPDILISNRDNELIKYRSGYLCMTSQELKILVGDPAFAIPDVVIEQMPDSSFVGIETDSKKWW